MQNSMPNFILVRTYLVRKKKIKSSSYLRIEPMIWYQTHFFWALRAKWVQLRIGRKTTKVQPNPFRVQCSRRFREIDPENVHSHEFNVPLPSLLRMNGFFFFFLIARCLGLFLYFWDIWVLRDPRFPAKSNKTRKKHHSYSWQLGCTLNTCMCAEF